MSTEKNDFEIKLDAKGRNFVIKTTDESKIIGRAKRRWYNDVKGQPIMSCSLI